MTQLIQAGSKAKSGPGKLTIDFPKQFIKIPIVVVSSFWQNQGAQVTNIEIIDTVSHENFTIVSDNAASTYFVNWVAIGEE